MRIKTLVREFQKYNLNHRKPATCRFYEQRLRPLVDAHGHKKVGWLNPQRIEKFLSKSKNGPTTRHHDAVVITRLQSWALKSKLIKAPWFTEALEKPRVGRRERIPTADEIVKLLANAAPDFRLIYTALSQCGARPGELAGAQIADLHWDQVPRIELADHKTATKTGKPRIIPIGSELEPTLRLAIGERTEGPVFLRSNGQPWSVNCLSSLHRRLRDAAGLDKTIVLYSARHRFATELLRANVPINSVRILMGHSSVTMTERYAHQKETELIDVQGKVPRI